MRKFYGFLCKIEEAACGAGLIFLILFIFTSAIFRFLKISQSWYIDLAMLCLAWTSFLGADVAWRHGQILGVDLLVKRLPARLRGSVELIVLLVILALLGVIAVFGVRLAWIDRLAKYQSMPIPYSLVTYSLVVASLSMILTTVLRIRRTLASISKKGASR